MKKTNSPEGLSRKEISERWPEFINDAPPAFLPLINIDDESILQDYLDEGFLVDNAYTSFNPQKDPSVAYALPLMFKAQAENKEIKELIGKFDIQTTQGIIRQFLLLVLSRKLNNND